MRTMLSQIVLGLLVVSLGGCEIQPVMGGSQTPEEALFVPVSEGRITTDGGATRGVAWGDFDADGDPDLYTGNTGGQWNAFYRNLLLGAQGDGRPIRDGDDTVSVERPLPDPASGHAGFVKLSAPNLSSLGEAVRYGGSSQGASWVDYDGDGDLDLFVANRNAELDFLFRNDGSDGFVRITDSGLTELALGASMACWADVDGDGWLDVFLVRYGGAPNGLFRNLGGGRFQEVRDSPLRVSEGEGRACAWADADGNGFPDLYVANNTNAPNRYFLNRGQWNFETVEQGHAVEHVAYSYGVSWADYDADGDLDLFVANGTYAPDMRNFVYLNQGDGTFRRDMRGAVAMHADTSAGAAWADYDRDGDLDLFVASWGGSDEVNRFYRNTASERYERSWLGLRLRGQGPNTFAVGARVKIVARIEGEARRMRRWQWPVTGYGSQNEQLIHFGLGTADVVDSVIIRWPSGREDVHTGLAPGRFLVVEEGTPPRPDAPNR